MMVSRTLVDLTRTGLVVPLIGAGISMESGMPSWDTIVASLHSRLRADLGSDVDFDAFDTPDAFREVTGRAGDLTRILNEAFGDGYLPNSLHESLAAMPIRTCLTTNWDSLLEESFRLRRRVHVIADERSARLWRESEALQVVKFHGSLHAPESIVFGLRDYARFYMQSSVLMSLVRTIIATRPLLLCGFSASDVFVKALLQSIQTQGSREHFIVLPSNSLDSQRARYLESLGLSIIEAPTSSGDPYGSKTFLQSLATAAALEATDRVGRTRLLIRETKRLDLYLGADLTLRVRAALGPLAVPEDDAVDVFGNSEVLEVEQLLAKTVEDLLLNPRARVRILCSPLQEAQAARAKGYTPEAYASRLRAFADRVRRLGPRVEVAFAPRSSDQNDWIAADQSITESRKPAAQDGRLYDYGRVSLDSAFIRSSISRFDEEFSTLLLAAGGSEVTRNALFAAAAQV
jgi:hypothetical protein